MTDFDTKRRAEEQARRARAVSRDAERREALAAGARAPSEADGSDPGGVLRAVAIGAGAVGAAGLMLGLLMGAPLAVLVVGAAVIFGGAAVALRQSRIVRLGAGRGQPGALTSPALSTASTEDQAWGRAKAAVQAADDLDTSRRKAILEALDAARESLRAGVGPERVAAFVGRCDEIVASLGSLPVAGDPTAAALEHLDAVTIDLAEEATAKAEIEEALRTARGVASRQVEG